MRYNTPVAGECHVYPGGYIPLPEIGAIVSDLKSHNEDSSGITSINYNDMEDCFKIGLALPGISREDIYIHVDDHILNIIVLHKQNEVLKEKLQIPEFETDFIERHLLLPDNADAEFVSAEYSHDELSVYISKNQANPKNTSSQIVVY